EDDIGGLLLQLAQRVGAVDGERHAVAALAQDVGQHLPHRGGIVGDQNGGHGVLLAGDAMAGDAGDCSEPRPRRWPVKRRGSPAYPPQAGAPGAEDACPGRWGMRLLVIEDSLLDYEMLLATFTLQGLPARAERV